MEQTHLSFGTGELNHDAMVAIEANITDLYATKTLFDGLKLKFKTVVTTAVIHGDIDSYIALFAAPGSQKVIKIAHLLCALAPTTPLAVGGQQLNITYGTDITGEDIGHFSATFLQSSIATIFDMTPATGGATGNEVYENIGINAGLSAGAGIVSGNIVLTFYIWYFEVNLLATVGAGGVSDIIVPQDITTITTTATIDGSLPIYDFAHPTTPFTVLLNDTATKGIYRLSNSGVAVVTFSSFTGPGTVLIAGAASIYLGQKESVELSLVKLNGTIQFIVLSGVVNIPI